jgi:uncharacterized protein with HEPN domain
MRPDDDDAARVWDIVTYGRHLLSMAEGRTYQEFLSDVQFRLAAERCIEIIGEAAAHVSDGFRAKYADIPWPQIVGLRNIIVHGYAQLDPEKLWRVVDNEICVLVERLSPLQESTDDDATG